MVPHPARLDPVRYRYLRPVRRGRGFSLPPRFRWGLVAVVAAVYVAYFVAGERGIIRKAQVRRELAAVQAEAAKLRAEKNRLEREVLLKENDPFSLEKVAREEYMMLGPNETIFRFEEEEQEPLGESPPAALPEAGSQGIDAPRDR